MKKKIYVLGVLGLLAVFLFGCGNSLQQTRLEDGTLIVQGERTGAFGTDNSFVYIVPQTQPVEVPVYSQAPMIASPTPAAVAPQPPKKVLVEKSYTRSSTSWTGCPDEKPNRRAKNVKRSEKKEKWIEEVVVPSPAPQVQAPPPVAIAPPVIIQPQPPIFWAAGNPSAGNMALPSVFYAAGMVGGAAALRPNQTNISQTGGGATIRDITAQGGAGGGGGSVGNVSSVSRSGSVSRSTSGSNSNAAANAANNNSNYNANTSNTTVGVNQSQNTGVGVTVK